MSPEKQILYYLAERFPAHRIAGDCLTLLHKGRFANALVFRYNDGRLNLAIKDFSHCPAPIRATFGRICISRECAALTSLTGLPGITPNVYRLSPLAAAYDYIEGTPLVSLDKKKAKLPPAFFLEMEKRIEAMHARNLVHLDLRNMGNVVVGRDDMPHFIDFQSTISIKNMPAFLSGLLKDIDRSAVCKAWLRRGSEPLPADKVRFLEEFSGKRKFWLLKGYPGRRLWTKLKPAKEPIPLPASSFTKCESASEKIPFRAKSA